MNPNEKSGWVSIWIMTGGLFIFLTGMVIGNAQNEYEQHTASGLFQTVGIFLALVFAVWVLRMVYLAGRNSK